MTAPRSTRRAFLAGCLFTAVDLPSPVASWRAADAVAAVPDRLAMVEIADGIHVARGAHAVIGPDNGGHIANLTIVIGRDAVAVVDTGGSYRVGAALHAAVRALTDRPVRYVILTHMHPDHVLGTAAFMGSGAEIVAHAKLPRALAARAARYLAHSRDTLGPRFEGSEIVMPAHLVSTGATLDLGGRTLELHAHGTAHTDNDLSVRDATTRTTILGDLLFAEHIPTLDGSLRGWQRELDRLATVQTDRLVPGHGPASLPWPAGLVPQRRYLDTIARDVKALITSGKTLDVATNVAARDEAGSWLLSQEYHTRNVTAAFAELEWE